VNDSLATTAEGRSVLRMQRRLDHPPEKVWRAVTESEHLGAWFPTSMSAELRIGGRVRFGFVGDGTVTDLEPPRLFAYTWEDDHLRWELVPDGAGTVLVLVHTFDDRAGAASFGTGWHTCLLALAGLLAGAPGEPDLDHRALHERYIEQFGLDAGTVEDTPDGWRVRVERQLVQPAEAAWPLLVDGVPAAATVVTAQEPDLLEYDLGPGRVRIALAEGTGHGARLVLTESGAADAADARDAAAAEWPRRVAALAARLA
jgi:uncharacterized protein YndB with AHSA1/START domain